MGDTQKQLVFSSSCEITEDFQYLFPIATPLLDPLFIGLYLISYFQN